MIDVRRVFRRFVICLIVALALTVAAAPVFYTQSRTAWAADSKKKTSGKKKKASRKEGFVKKNGNWYYYHKGKKKTGWFTHNGRKFYGIRSGGSKGKLVQGWFTIKDKKYYFRRLGKKGVVCSLIADCVAKINGIKCIFDEKGELVKCKYAGSREGFVNQVGEMARLNQAYNDILASLVVAQACVETGYGGSVYGNNLFGIMGPVSPKRYDSWDESLEDYVDFMHTYIPGIFGVRDAGAACAIIGRSGYAAAPNYGSALISVVNSENLTRFNR